MPIVLGDSSGVTLQDWEAYFGGLTFGGSRTMGLRSIDGYSPPDAREDIDDYSQDDGAFVVAEFSSYRRFTVECDLSTVPGLSFEQALDAARLAFAYRSADSPFVFKFAGASQRRINCRPVRVGFPVDQMYGMGYSVLTAQFVAGDPRIYSDAESVITATPEGGNVGADMPIDFDIAFGTGSSGTSTGLISVVNNGTYNSPPEMIINGPFTSLTLQNLTTGKSLSYAYVVDAGQQAEFDFRAKTIYVAGTSRYSGFQAGSSWWKLAPGSNTIKFTATGSSGSTLMSMGYRDAWL
jgi:hypothetical protein